MTSYSGYIDGVGNNQPPIPLSTFSFHEGYNSGWRGSCKISLSAQQVDNMIDVLVLGVRLGLSPSLPVSVLLALSGADPVRPPLPESGSSPDPSSEEDASSPLGAGSVVRIWPSIVTSLEPSEGSGNTMELHVGLTDPITYLSDRSIWGAYRATSAAKMIGGALSLATGGDGQPTLSPVLPNMPVLKIIDNLRPDLAELPYSIASGQTLQEWLDDMTGMLGIRIEYDVNPDDSIDIILTDKKPSGSALQVNPLFTQVNRQGTSEQSSSRAHGNIYVTSIQANHGLLIRSGVLDDPLQGSLRRFGTAGSIGHMINGNSIPIEEAQRRTSFEASRATVELMTLSCTSRQPAVRPGRVMNTGQPFLGILEWQILSAYHELNVSNYLNSVVIGNAALAWYPSSPELQGTTYITGSVDGGVGMRPYEPVSRDRLGRVAVSLPFLPLPTGEASTLLLAGDRNQDLLVTLDDFSKSEIENYANDQLANQALDWDDLLKRYNAGEFNDPFPNREDADLGDAERKQRDQMSANRSNAIRYEAYQAAKRREGEDRDKDGYITRRDQALSSELDAKLRTQSSHDVFREQIASRRRGTSDSTGGEQISDELLDEYEGLFLSPASADQEDPNAALRREADLDAQRWPPRIPLTIIEPMAGGVHGFIPGHRQGDICRIAVHHPMYAELIGFQYRSNKSINQTLVGATAGMVVEHDFQSAWSGMVFRPTSNLETPIPSSTGDSSGS